MPTRRGWAVAAASIACYLAGWGLGYPELAVVGVGGALALVAGGVWLARSIPLELHRDIAPVRVARGDPAIGVLTCVHRGRWRLDAMSATDRCGTTEVAVDLPELRPGGTCTTSYFLPTRRRGHLPVGPLRLVATDPLGLFRRVRAHGGTVTLYVQPKTVSLTALPSGRVPNPDGPRADRAAGGTVTFHSLRQYEFGDDLRHIHWRTSARTGTLMVRQLVDTSLPRSVVLLDNRAGAYGAEDDFELAVDVTASVALGAAALGFPVSVVCGDQEVSTMDGERTPPSVLLDRLSLVGTRSATAVVPDGRGPVRSRARRADLRHRRSQRCRPTVDRGARG